jgi:hypothetical protein
VPRFKFAQSEILWVVCQFWVKDAVDRAQRGQFRQRWVVAIAEFVRAHWGKNAFPNRQDRAQFADTNNRQDRECFAKRENATQIHDFPRFTESSLLP